MKPHLWLSVLGLLVGCAQARPAAQPSATTSATAAAAPAASPLFELPYIGLKARPPGPVEIIETEQQVVDGTMRSRGISCWVGPQHYFVTRYTRGGRDRTKDEEFLQNAGKQLQSVSRKAPLRMGEFQGVELEGTGKSGESVWTRRWPAGDGFWVAQVQRKDGPLDKAPARAFLDSITFAQTWSVRAFPEAHFSVSLPDDAVRLDKATLKLEDFTVAEASWMGGVEERIFSVFARPMEESTESADERMDRALEAMTRDGTRAIWQAPVVVDQARGRDFLLQGKNTWMRLRFVVDGTNLYVLQAASRTKEGLSDESVPRFLASLRWY